GSRRGPLLYEHERSLASSCVGRLAQCRGQGRVEGLAWTMISPTTINSAAPSNCRVEPLPVRASAWLAVAWAAWIVPSTVGGVVAQCPAGQAPWPTVPLERWPSAVAGPVLMLAVPDELLVGPPRLRPSPMRPPDTPRSVPVKFVEALLVELLPIAVLP